MPESPGQRPEPWPAPSRSGGRPPAPCRGATPAPRSPRLPRRPRDGGTSVSFGQCHNGLQRITMSKNLYVGNLPFNTTADDLLEVFGQHGTVSRAQVISDKETGRSRGFGFVEMSAGGDQAIEALNGAEFQG